MNSWLRRGLSFGIALAALVAGLAIWTVAYRAHYDVAPVILAEGYQARILQKDIAAGVRPGMNKLFAWRSEDRRRTPVSVVYLHGWSASRQEISPVAETLAADLDANLFMTRFCGHGLGHDGMRDAKAQCLLDDAEEAFAVGRAMGERVILVATSTGAALALQLALDHPDVAALILVSPNFRPARMSSLLLKGPFGKWMAGHLGDHRFRPHSPEEERYWTTAYPMTALHEMMNLLSFTNGIDLRALRVPMLMIVSSADDTIALPPARTAFGRYGGPKEWVELEGTPHVLAGAIMNPAGTPAVLAAAEKFLAREKVASGPRAGEASPKHEQ